MAKKREVPDLSIRNPNIESRRASRYSNVWGQIRETQRERLAEQMRTMTDPERFREFPPDDQLFMGIRALESIQEAAQKAKDTEKATFATEGLGILEERYHKVGHVIGCVGTARLISPPGVRPQWNPRN